MFLTKRVPGILYANEKQYYIPANKNRTCYFFANWVAGIRDADCYIALHTPPQKRFIEPSQSATFYWIQKKTFKAKGKLIRHLRERERKKAFKNKYILWIIMRIIFFGGATRLVIHWLFFLLQFIFVCCMTETGVFVHNVKSERRTKGASNF